MHRTRNQNRGSFQLHGETIPELLHAAKTVLSDRQYRELCAAVNETAGYANKRGLIFAAVQSRMSALARRIISGCVMLCSEAAASFW